MPLYLDPPLLLHFQREDASRFTLGWDPCRCTLTRADGTLHPFPHALRQAVRAQWAASRRPAVHNLRIKLGEACNMRCAYCMQGDHPPFAPVSDGAVSTLLQRIRRQCERDPQLSSFTFWGGEPLVYFSALRALTEGIRAFAPDAEFSVTTNGMLLNRDVADFFLRHGFFVSLSHDGPGQWRRGADPLAEGTASRDAVDAMLASGGDRLSFACVLSAGNPGPQATADWFAVRFGAVPLDGGNPCMPTDAASLACAIPQEDLPGYSGLLFRELCARPDLLPRYNLYSHDVQCMLRILDSGDPTPGGGHCFAYQSRPLVVDMEGNILACHNVGATFCFPGGMPNRRGLLGDEPAPVRLADWRTRPECRICPVLPLCRGGCPIVGSEMRERQCEVNFHHYMALFAYALAQVTEGGLLMGFQKNGPGTGRE